MNVNLFSDFYSMVVNQHYKEPYIKNNNKTAATNEKKTRTRSRWGAIASPHEKKIAYKTLFALKDCLAIIRRLLCLVANLSDGLKLMDQSFITCDDINKLFLVKSWKHFKQLFFASLTRYLFCSSVDRCGTHLANIFRTFKCFLKIR